ncbi:MAG: hypothetical protein K5787_01490, partial [Lentisphaeria bacterium]|nr:hypothetical protein [Lentisphaeria bacterium]
PKAKSQKPKAKSQKPKAKSQKPKAKSQKPKAKSQKPKAKSQKPKAEFIYFSGKSEHEKMHHHCCFASGDWTLGGREFSKGEPYRYA